MITVGRILLFVTVAPVLLVLNSWCLWISNEANVSILAAAEWIIAYCIPHNGISGRMQEHAWRHWIPVDENQKGERLELPTIDFRDFRYLLDNDKRDDNDGDSSNDMLQYVESKYGKDWRKRPLLIKNLWTPEELADPNRQLSMEGLMKMNDIQLPYFSNTTTTGRYAYTPDAVATLPEFLTKLQNGGHIKATTPEVISGNRTHLLEVELARPSLRFLFGETFTTERVKERRTTGVFFFRRHPCNPAFDATCTTPESPGATHCEPVSNVALQLQGVRYWVLAEPKHMFRMLPASAAVPRGYVHGDQDPTMVPHYYLEHRPGDALFVPAWTWHRVNYMQQETLGNDPVALGVGMFHFDPVAFFTNNPIMAPLIIPSMIREKRGTYSPKTMVKQILGKCEQDDQQRLEEMNKANDGSVDDREADDFDQHKQQHFSEVSGSSGGDSVRSNTIMRN